MDKAYIATIKLEKQIAIIRTYVSEEGQEIGSVSGQMVNTALDVIRDIFIKTTYLGEVMEDQQWPDWVETKPTKSGIYLFRDKRELTHKVYVVSEGLWRLNQNPDLLYVGSMPLDSFAEGYWLGPIPKSPGL